MLTCRWIAAFLLCALSAVAQESKILQDFESEDQLKVWSFKKDSDYFKDKEMTAFNPALSNQHATSGKHSVKIAPNEYMSSLSLPKDWSAYQALELDVFVEGDEPVAFSVLMGDDEWRKNPTYWNRHNGFGTLKPGANTLSLPVYGLFRGEAGSRGNDKSSNLDPKAIQRLDLGFEPKGKATALYIDTLRLVKESAPEGVLAFDFGPASQTIFPGFTPITWNSVFGQNEAKAGLRRAGWGPNQARDDTFPTRLYQDFVEMGGQEFVASVPNGKYHVWVVFDDCGYWGGENARHTRRAIAAEGKEGWVDDRGAEGPSDYLFRFENIEPHPGDSIWDLYMAGLFKPARLSADVADGELNLSFTCDAGWSCKVAAVIVYPDAKKADAEKWIAEIEARNKKEFENRAVCLGPKPNPLQPPPEAAKQGYWVGYPESDEEITLVDAPGRAAGKLHSVAARGQAASTTFALRPLADLGAAKMTASELKGPAGSIPASAIDLRYVHHALRRNFNEISYVIQPETLRRVEGSALKLSKDLTRQFWITVDVPSNAGPGTYSGQVEVIAGATKVALPLSIEVLDVALDEPDFPFAYFGAWVPGELPAERRKNGDLELLKFLKKSGMTTVCGGPDIAFTGFDADGKPQLDFTACDAFFKSVKEAGFTQPIYSYGGPGTVSGLHETYSIGQTGRDWEKKTGKTFVELMRIVWTAVKEHAEKEKWPTINYGQLDEPRVEAGAKANLEFHKAFREAAPWVRTGGYYSVHWDHNDPMTTAIQDLFKTMVWSGLGVWGQVDLDKGKEFGREVHLYNQGSSRHMFGLFQWAMMNRGVKGRVEWHLLALHGYQFFDLDGREPDTAMINWGRREIIPTMKLIHNREGATDFRFAVTLARLAKSKDTPEAKAALAWINGWTEKIPAAHREIPKELGSADAFRAQCIEHLRKVLAK